MCCNKTNIDAFLASLRAEGRSKKTIQEYRWHLRKFCRWLGNDEISQHALQSWNVGLFDQWEPATIKTAIVALRSYLQFCHKNDFLKEDFSRLLKTPRVPQKPQRTLTAEEIAKMLAACDRTTPKGIRDAAIISVLADSGIRSQELCRLNIPDLDLAKKRLTVLRKGGNTGYAYIGQTTAERLEVWLRERALLPTTSQALFVSLGGYTPGKPLTPRGLRSILKKIGDSCGVPGVSPHAFRRAFACLLVEQGVNIRLIQALGGWSDLRQVQRYTAALEVERLAPKCSPIDQLERERSPQLPLWAEWP